ncbi:trypsin-like peptidase domain-containing protein [Candidatus Woesearchaeota archaeon]|nr:trypsin-like peptidase domain-containing protein [Candidatus Woesearchaeota archaeon]
METKHHLFYSFVLILIVSSLLYTGNTKLTELEQDYTSQIEAIKTQLDTTKLVFLDTLNEKQKQINVLNSELKVLDQSLGQTIEEYDLQIGELEKSTKIFKSQIQSLKYSSDIYGEQLGQLDQQISDLQVESESFTTVIANVIDSVVSIHTNLGQGSGAIISANGLVVTNHHVIDGITSASIVTYNGNAYNVELIGYNIENDLAVLKIVSDETFNYFNFANSDNLQTGQKIVALGNPAGLSFTATEGIISSPHRKMNGLDFIQTDVTLNPGNSGGPIININGEIVGIVDFKISGYDSLSFAIPSNRVKTIVSEIVD